MDTPQIESYRFGLIKIDGLSYRKDLIILPSGVLPDWWRRRGHWLTIDDLSAVMEAAPELLIIGSGAYGRMLVAQDALQVLDRRGIRMQVAKTAEACEIYNLQRLTSKTAAALHLTC